MTARTETPREPCPCVMYEPDPEADPDDELCVCGDAMGEHVDDAAECTVSRAGDPGPTVYRLEDGDRPGEPEVEVYALEEWERPEVTIDTRGLT